MIAVSLAPAAAWSVASPTWERIDDDYNVGEISIDRGRENEMTQTGTGTASVELVDRAGAFDPTNPTGAFFGRLQAGVPMGPLVQAKVELQNPVTLAWSTLFRGFTSRIVWTPYRSMQHANVTLELADGLGILAAAEMAPKIEAGNPVFGDAVEHGDIVFAENTLTDAVKTRIARVLDQAGWPGTLRSIFTGNVSLWRTVYSPRTSVLQVIQDAADAEFPHVANVYIGGPRNPGFVVFHGRYARFNPAGVEYGIKTWQVSDDVNAQTDVNRVRVSPPLVASLDDTLLYTSALATYSTIVDADIPGQYVTDTAAVSRVGLRTWSAENLATRGGAAGRTAAQETKLMADYVRDNFAKPAVRVGQLMVKSRRPSSFNGAATWKLLCEVDISDVVHLKTTHGGGGGFDTDFYVEGVHYVIRPGGTLPYAELVLDVSPASYYGSNPWAAA